MALISGLMVFSLTLQLGYNYIKTPKFPVELKVCNASLVKVAYLHLGERVLERWRASVGFLAIMSIIKVKLQVVY